MGRFYTVTTGPVACIDVQDLIELKAGTATPFVVHLISVTQLLDVGDAEAENLLIKIKKAGSTYTSGSGGGSLSVAKSLNGDAADSFAGEEANNTTQAVINTGYLNTIWQEDFNAQAGWQWFPPPEWQKSHGFFNVSEALILSLETTPADSLTITATALVEELG